MYNFQIIIYYCCVLFYSTLAEKCTTPTGLPGECVPLSSCPPLLWSFANTKHSFKYYLAKFLCPSVEGVRVCCNTSIDILALENDADTYSYTHPNAETNIKHLVNVKDCGIQKNPVKDGIAGLYDFPWLVKMMIVDNRVLASRIEKVACTGVLINEWYIMYSLVCHNNVLVQPHHQVFVRIEAYNGKTEECLENSYSKNCSTFAIYEIDAYLIHTFFDIKTNLNDIALMRLSRRVKFSEYVRPICLPIRTENLPTGQLLYTAGWNRTFLRNHRSVKIAYSSSLISNEDCEERLAKDRIKEVITEYRMCTINPGSVNEMEVFGYPTMSLQNNRWYLEGFKSSDKDYEPPIPKIHTRMQNYLQWIKHTLGGELCRTPFNELGECGHLSDCPRLMDVYANSAAEDVDALSKFLCKNPNLDWTDNTAFIKVCCGVETNFTVRANSIEEEELPYNMSDYRFCGQQHRNDYSSDNDTVNVDGFPWLASIINATSPGQGDRICGGTLITQRHVLTSGQCILSFSTNDTMLIRLGDHNLKNATDCLYDPQLGTQDCIETQEYEVEKRIVHPFFHRYTLLNDVALLRLNKNVEFSDYASPICLQRTEADLGNNGDTFLSTGFGDNNEAVEGPNITKIIRTTLISNEECRDKLKLLSVVNPITTHQICTENFQNLTDVVCYGDVGGPLMYYRKPYWFIVGITSTFGCHKDEPQTHTTVFKFLTWIKQNIEN